MERTLGRFLRAILFLILNTLHVDSMQTVSLVDSCGQSIRADGIIINSHQESQKGYFVTVGTDCEFTMEAISPRDKIQFQFRFFLVYSLLRESSILQPITAVQLLQPNVTGTLSLLSTSRPGQRVGLPLQGEEVIDTCNAGSYVRFYDGKDRHSPPIRSLLCGKRIPKPVLSTGNYLTLRLVTRGQQPRVDFVGDFTSFQPGFETSACSEEQYFQCQNGKCIPKSLVCDSKSIDNCGDGSDESELHPTKCKDSKSYVSLLALYIILGVIAGLVLLFWCCWSPGWFIWRLSVCRFLPCCNSFCAACQLCTHSCCQTDNNRLSKVTPQSSVPVPV
ncbi:low-density lipoprotein receptor class A domain-containing protein 2 isoform X3 [Chiloscyllium plagiosum]|uniref:low-density lipoprotein receptor class A domain-containing protein 2 isoform X3 n=1 Tax=Chiloscyllium plagiosum TaxID=36176 RepID=UPI001CB82E90|nr:low-density lipoprotein receptor class A domain-containing protein 2 isoform X3 [Chiloscyllium plagiosum]